MTGAYLTWAYRLDGLLASRQWPSGAGGQATLAYDGAKRPTGFTKAGSAAAAFSQAYDRDGNVTAEGRNLAGIGGDAGNNAQAFSYDGLHRVTASSGLATSFAYTYDRDSNRLTATVGGTTTTYFSYDVYGNLTSHANAPTQTTALTYDLGDRLTSVVLPGMPARA